MSHKNGLSPSQAKIVELFRRLGNRYLPKNIRDIQGFLPDSAFVLGSHWVWSWEIVQNCHTADYRRRIHELRERGYHIASFYTGNPRRHGYILIAEPLQEERAA